MTAGLSLGACHPSSGAARHLLPMGRRIRGWHLSSPQRGEDGSRARDRVRVLACRGDERGVAAGRRGVDADMTLMLQAGDVIGGGQDRQYGAIATGKRLADRR
jgi:hypothetical protein